MTARGELEPLTLCFTLPPRLGRRVRALALDLGCHPNRLAALWVARAAVPDRGERGRLVFRDLHEAGLGSLVGRRRPAKSNT